MAAVAGNTVVDRWGDAAMYLRQQGYFTKQHEAFITSLYTLISDASVHPFPMRPMRVVLVTPVFCNILQGPVSLRCRRTSSWAKLLSRLLRAVYRVKSMSRKIFPP